MTTTKHARRHYYAEFCPYGIATMCAWGDRLMRFDSTAERDAVVDCINAAHYFDHPEGVAREVNIADVRHRYNIKAFNDSSYGECYEVREPRCIQGHYWEIGPRY